MSFALSEAQREIKLLPELRDDAATVFNILMVLESSAQLDMASVRGALRALTMRHEALRTAFEDRQQHVLPFADPVLDEVGGGKP